MSFSARAAWCTAAAIAADLLAWLQILALDGDLAKANPKRLRYRILNTAASLTRPQRRRRLRIPHQLAWIDHITAALARTAAIPAPRLTSTAAIPTTRRTALQICRTPRLSLTTPGRVRCARRSKADRCH
jgi:hypothetical protein